MCVFLFFCVFVYIFGFIHIKLIVNKRGRQRRPPPITLSIVCLKKYKTIHKSMNKYIKMRGANFPKI